MPGMLLGVHCKRADPIGMKDAILSFVRSMYGENAARDSAEDLAEIEALRAQLITHIDAPPGVRETQMKYYRALSAMESRFPVSQTPGHVDLAFVWHDAFRPQRRAEQVNMHFEKAAVLFNLAAAASQQALSADRKTAQGLIESARGFQEAAGLFAALRDGPAQSVHSPRPVDVSPECAGMLEKLMLAQAQECVCEKAAADGKAAGTLARLWKHAAALYDECHQALVTKPLSDHFDRTWQAHTSVKALLHHLEAHLCNAADLRSKDDIKGVANEIAQLRASHATLTSAKREAKAASQELQDNVSTKERIVSERLAKAEKENASIYLQRVPQAVDLPGIVPAALVKPLPPSGLGPTPESEALFRGVVPETTTRALSRYTDLVDGLIRKQMHKLDKALDDVRVKLREWELPERLHALEPGSISAVPEGLKADLSKVAERGGVPHLSELVVQLQQLRLVARNEVEAAEAVLEAEDREDEEMRARFGTRWRRPPSAQLTGGMRDRINGYRGNLTAAESADAQLESRFNDQASSFAALDLESVAAQMPRLDSPIMSIDDMEPASAVASLRAGLDGLATLSSQRAALEEALRQCKASDDILSKLLAGTSEPEELFKKELRKYDDLVQGVNENVEKQAQLLEVVKNANVTFTRAFGHEDWRRRCDGVAQRVRSTVQSYIRLADNLAEGVQFYSQLQDAVHALRQQVADHCSARRVEKDQLVASLRAETAAQEAAAQAGLASMSVHHGAYQHAAAGMAPQHPHPQQPYVPWPGPLDVDGQIFSPTTLPSGQPYQQQHPPQAYPSQGGAQPPPHTASSTSQQHNNPLGNLFGFNR